MTEKDFTAETIARMNAAIEQLDIPEGMYMKLKVGSVKCVKTYLEGQQRRVNSDSPGSYPSFLRVVEIFNELKTKQWNKES